VLPGFLSDILGLILLLPPTQHWIRATLRRAMADAGLAGAGTTGAQPGVVDLEPGQWRQVPEQQIADRTIKPRGGRD
jgi:UPF0716 family protein affecting phage T7 exclusion